MSVGSGGSSEAPVRAGRIALAWGVHAFTASGALFGTAALVSFARGEEHAGVLCMLAALFIDAVDGMAARAVGVRQVLPHFDGRRLDDMVDFFNYVLVPAFFLVSAGMVVHGAWVALPILASAYGFSQDDAKTEDDFFLGFPSYWNVFAIYAWLLEVPVVWLTALLALLSVGVFVPFKYLYPSRMRMLFRTNVVLCALAAALVFGAVVFPERGRALHLAELSLLYPAFYIGLSFWHGGLHRRSPES